MNTPFDPWPWRRRVLATAAAAAALTVVIGALVTAPPDSPQGIGSPPAGASVDESMSPGTDGEGAEKPDDSADPEKTDATKDGSEDDSEDGNGGDKDDDNGKPPGEGGDDGDDPPPPPAAHITRVSVSAGKAQCTTVPGCIVTATVTVTAYDKRGVTLNVTIAGSSGTGSRTYTYDLSGQKSYTVSVPGSQGQYKMKPVCDSDDAVVVSASGSGKSASDSVACQARP